jgi:hypothetical protein
MSPSSGSHTNFNETETRRLRHQLELEIHWLSRQMDELKCAETELDISLQQTYKEMIYSRRALLGRIPR